MDIKNKRGKQNTIDFDYWKKINDKIADKSGVSTLFSKGKRVTSFFTEDSKLYISPKQSKLLEKGYKIDNEIGKWDSLSSRIVKNYQSYRPSKNDALYRKLQNKVALINDEISSASKSFVEQFSVVRLWNLSIIGAILFGMFSMTMIYRYLGVGASAGMQAYNEPKVEMAENSSVLEKTDNEIANEIINSIAQQDKKEFEEKVKEMVKGYPIEKMLPYILEKDRTVAAFIIAIGKKESNWGKRVPVLNGQDCYNYWGYRGKRKLMGTGGHTCFNGRKDAVDTVAQRIETLVKEKNLDSPSKMIVWKCGSSCAGHGKESVDKWISDVDMYFGKLQEENGS